MKAQTKSFRLTTTAMVLAVALVCGFCGYQNRQHHKNFANAEVIQPYSRIERAGVVWKRELVLPSNSRVILSGYSLSRVSLKYEDEKEERTVYQFMKENAFADLRFDSRRFILYVQLAHLPILSRDPRSIIAYDLIARRLM
jgi:hypothetical protein